MIGPVDFDRSVDYWQQDKWSGQFPVKWHIIKDVPNNLLWHIILENNDNKPVTNSRDTQEVNHAFFLCDFCSYCWHETVGADNMLQVLEKKRSFKPHHFVI